MLRKSILKSGMATRRKALTMNGLPIALIGKPTNHVFPVSWLMTPIDAARKELDFYLADKHEANPWAYAKYHCNTAANMYSKVHWSYFTNAIPRQALSSPNKSS